MPESLDPVGRVLRISLILSLLCVPATAVAAGGTAQVWVATDCLHARYKPKEIVFACGDGSEFVKKLAWSSWTRTHAAATGTDEINDCRPSCVSGHFHGYRVSLTLSKPKSCRRHKHKVFSHAALTFGGSRPSRRRTEQWPLPCLVK
jgi:hypothetical protein